MSIKVITPGLLSNIQDNGRFGLQRIGMSPAGTMDLHSLRLANILADTLMDEAEIEMTMLGASLQFGQACAFAQVDSPTARAICEATAAFDDSVLYGEN